MVRPRSQGSYAERRAKEQRKRAASGSGLASSLSGVRWRFLNDLEADPYNVQEQQDVLGVSRSQTTSGRPRRSRGARRAQVQETDDDDYDAYVDTFAKGRASNVGNADPSFVSLLQRRSTPQPQPSHFPWMDRPSSASRPPSRRSRPPSASTQAAGSRVGSRANSASRQRPGSAARGRDGKQHRPASGRSESGTAAGSRGRPISAQSGASSRADTIVSRMSQMTNATEDASPSPVVMWRPSGLVTLATHVPAALRSVYRTSAPSSPDIRHAQTTSSSNRQQRVRSAGVRRRADDGLRPDPFAAARGRDAPTSTQKTKPSSPARTGSRRSQREERQSAPQSQTQGTRARSSRESRYNAPSYVGTFAPKTSQRRQLKQYGAYYIPPEKWHAKWNDDPQSSSDDSDVEGGDENELSPGKGGAKGNGSGGANGTRRDGVVVPTHAKTVPSASAAAAAGAMGSGADVHPNYLQRKEEYLQSKLPKLYISMAYKKYVQRSGQPVPSYLRLVQDKRVAKGKGERQEESEWSDSESDDGSVDDLADDVTAAQSSDAE